MFIVIMITDKALENIIKILLDCFFLEGDTKATQNVTLM